MSQQGAFRTVREIMSDHLVSIPRGDSMEAAAKRMERLKIRHLAVTDEQGEIIGVLSDRDVQRAMSPTISLDDSAPGLYSEVDRFEPDSRVKHFMGWPAKKIRAQAGIDEAAACMLREKLSCLLVADEDQVIGVVTTDDILRTIAKER